MQGVCSRVKPKYSQPGLVCLNPALPEPEQSQGAANHFLAFGVPLSFPRQPVQLPPQNRRQPLVPINFPTLARFVPIRRQPVMHPVLFGTVFGRRRQPRLEPQKSGFVPLAYRKFPPPPPVGFGHHRPPKPQLLPSRPLAAAMISPRCIRGNDRRHYPGQPPSVHPEQR